MGQHTLRSGSGRGRKSDDDAEGGAKATQKADSTNANHRERSPTRMLSGISLTSLANHQTLYTHT
jgi:hypothetical protein